MLSAEWSKRKTEMEEEIMRREHNLRLREKNLLSKLEDLQKNEEEFEKQKKLFSDEQKRLKTNRTDTIHKLKNELKNKNIECIEKVAEIEVVENKLRDSEQEIRKVRIQKDSKRNSENNLSNNVKKLTAENAGLF